MSRQYRDYTGLSHDRLYRILRKRLQREDGYQMFGYDYPTLRMTRPQIASVLYECEWEINRVEEE